ncbi:MAG: BON domain-containing protein [Chloroflexi bacterium]|nr:BON domain-containing protein [Candidatus Rokubacteria bacterium]MBI2325478.1 BON domain-containing protein [Chloroflexota bacterium]
MTLLGIRDKTDRQIQLDVLAEIARDVRFRPAELGVEVDDGIVTLTGTVSSYVKLGQAADIAAAVYGVKDVANKLTVETATKLDDTRLAQAVRDALRWDVDVPEERIDSIVRDGVVTLKGTVDHWGQRAAARDAVAKIGGVRYVNDHLVVCPAPPRGDHQIFDDIKAALRRQLPTDDIDVAVDRGTVTLMGTVSWYGHRQRAEQAASNTAGVRSVTNKILVRA